MNRRVIEWRALLAHVERRESVDGGLRCVFAPTVDALTETRRTPP
jgi:hypothetical protein